MAGPDRSSLVLSPETHMTSNDPAIDPEDISQEMALARVENKLRVASDQVARRKFIDIGRRRQLHARSLPILAIRSREPRDPAEIVANREAVQVIELFASQQPFG